MSVLLIVVGAIVAVLGLGMAAYGIPVKEFSFGNTLILSGSLAVVGGIVIIAIGTLVAQLRRIADILAARPPIQAGQPAELLESPVLPRTLPPAPIPFPERPKPAAPVIPEPHPPASAFAADQPPAAAPMLRNPDAPVPLGDQFEIPEHEDVPLSPPAMPAPAALNENEPIFPPPPAARMDKIFPPSPSPHAHRPEPPPTFADESWTPSPPPPPRMERQAETSYFDTMWPADSRTPKPGVDEPQAEPRSPPPAPETPSEPVAILKSGVVDGMAYTLYVDGSIEAELPHGTLRFASINELRDHLAKGS